MQRSLDRVESGVFLYLWTLSSCSSKRPHRPGGPEELGSMPRASLPHLGSWPLTRGGGANEPHGRHGLLRGWLDHRWIRAGFAKLGTMYGFIVRDLLIKIGARFFVRDPVAYKLLRSFKKTPIFDHRQPVKRASPFEPWKSWCVKFLLVHAISKRLSI